MFSFSSVFDECLIDGDTALLKKEPGPRKAPTFRALGAEGSL